MSLPSKTLHHQAKDLASLVLSKAIAVKHATESLSNMTSSTSVPSSARINFKIQGTKSTSSLKEFKEIQVRTSEKVKEFQDYLKYEITQALKCEVDSCHRSLQKTLIHNTLMMSNNLVRFYKILFNASLNTDEKVLSEIAVNNVFDEFTEFARVEQINAVISNKFCLEKSISDGKFLKFLGLNSTSELLNLFHGYIKNVSYKLNTKKRNIDVNSVKKPSKSILKSPVPVSTILKPKLVSFSDKSEPSELTLPSVLFSSPKRNQLLK